MKKIIITFTLLLCAVCLMAQNICGTWYGTLEFHSKKLRIVFHISKTGEIYTTTMDSPDQLASGIATDKTTVAGNQVTITIAKMGMTYTGTVVPDSSIINGVFSQGQASVALQLTTTENKEAKATSPARPQDPTSFPYRQEEVSFTNPKAGNTLAGTITMPSEGKAKRIVVFITGSGPQNRNEEVVQFNHRPFLVWSDWLTRNGIAVLRFDDRGVGASTGVFTTSTSADFADDVQAAVNYIQSRSDLKNLSIGLMGHSEGGMIAPMVACSNNAVKFIILLAGPGIPNSELMIQQTADQMRLSGASDSEIATAARLNKKLYATMGECKNLPEEELKTKLQKMMRNELNKLPAQERGEDSSDAKLQEGVMKVCSPWYRYFITFDPADYLTRTQCPVLALNGTLDMQVSCAPNLKGINDCLQKAGNRNVQIAPLEGLNHLFQKATTGTVEEYGKITETVNPLALKTVTDWINKL